MAKFFLLLRFPKTRKDFNYTYIKKGIKMIADELKKIKKKKIVIIISTVLPGTIRKNILPVTNKYTQIGYNPFFIAIEGIMGVQ